MMGQLSPDQNALFYDFCLEQYVPKDHLLRQIDPFLDLSDLRDHLSSYYSPIGRPSVDPELMTEAMAVRYASTLRPLMRTTPRPSQQGRSRRLIRQPAIRQHPTAPLNTIAGPVDTNHGVAPKNHGEE
jgi:hypothetical protein